MQENIFIVVKTRLFGPTRDYFQSQKHGQLARSLKINDLFIRKILAASPTNANPSNLLVLMSPHCVTVLIKPSPDFASFYAFLVTGLK